MIGIISDAHGNSPAFEMAIRLLKKKGARRFIFLGDAIGYIPTVSVLHSIKRLNHQIQCISGNHEAILVSGKFNMQKEPVYQHIVTREHITDGLLSFINTWPKKIELEHSVGSALYIHAGPNDFTNEYIYPDTDLKQFSVSQSFVFMGHTHRPFIKKSGNTTFINVGSCGLPRDHGTLGSAVLFDEYTGEVRILRFKIKQELKQVKESFSGVHSSIWELQQRKPQTYIGEIIE